MAHKFHGLWKSFIVTGATLSDDGEIYLRINEANNTVDAGSNHNGRPVTGSVTQNSVDLTSDESTHKRQYQGALAEEINIGGTKILVLAGTMKPVRTIKDSTDESAQRDDAEILDQEQGTWVATKGG